MAGYRTPLPGNPTERDLRAWPRTLEEARSAQSALAGRVRISRLKKGVRFVGGADASFAGDLVVGVIAVVDLSSQSLIEVSLSVLPATFPYMPGYLSFREGPVLERAFRGLVNPVDALLCDGHGIAHPRRLGLASHLGIVLGVPSIGCAKSRLVGEYEEPPLSRGEWTSLRLGGRSVGAVLRTRTGVKPLFVSPGHGITLEESIGLVLACCTGCRLPEPLRAADRLSRRYCREHVRHALNNRASPGALSVP